MSKGEIYTRFTIWITLVGYTVGAALIPYTRRYPHWTKTARLIWTSACVSLFVHVASAFHFYHAWSYEAAFQETARQTAEVAGLAWGGGLFINYALMAGWVADVVLWWRNLDSYRARRGVFIALWQGFLLFIFFNATVVFKAGALRYIGLLLCLSLCGLWWHALGRVDAMSPNNELEISKRI